MLENSDISVSLQNTEGKRLYADFPNPINGGGDRRAYEKLRAIYDTLINYKD